MWLQSDIFFCHRNYQGNALLETKHKSSLNKAVAICAVNQIIYLKAEFFRSFSPRPHSTVETARHILSTATRHIHFSSRLQLQKKALLLPVFFNLYTF